MKIYKSEYVWSLVVTLLLGGGLGVLMYWLVVYNDPTKVNVTVAAPAVTVAAPVTPTVKVELDLTEEYKALALCRGNADYCSKCAEYCYQRCLQIEKSHCKKGR